MILYNLHNLLPISSGLSFRLNLKQFFNKISLQFIFVCFLRLLTSFVNIRENDAYLQRKKKTIEFRSFYTVRCREELDIFFFILSRIKTL